MRRTAVYRDDLFLEHQPGFGHVESPDRLRVVYEELDREDTGSHLLYPEFTPASREVIGLNHSPGLIQRVADTALRQHDALDADTQTSASSFAAACLAVGSLLDGMERIKEGQADNGFCLVRPPGHHAEEDRAMGFCLFNNVAVAAKWARVELGLERIFIFDWDLHHGNGTQKSFYDTDAVLYCSTHQYPFYPGSGSVLESGSGKGEGYTLNIPLPGGQGDAEYARIVHELVVPVARQYRPQFILVSCGFDIFGGDPLGTMRVSPAGFVSMTRALLELADEVCEGHLLVTLEGGYNLDGMRDGCLAVLTELSGERLNSDYPDFSGESVAQGGDYPQDRPQYLAQALSLAKNYWKM
jgi:acetoin utilization deacetylase AcuC-like enzyme